MKITVIHTTSATLASVPDLIRREIPDAEVFNILDDSILPDMCSSTNVDWVRKRWLGYVDVAVKNGADAVLSACSTVGEFAEEAERIFPAPVCRIDEAMAREAVSRGGTVCVMATLQSTLGPTVRLLRRIAEEQKSGCRILERLVDGAYDALMAGNRAEHDKRIMDTIAALDEPVTSYVLAQASMAGAIAGAGEELRSKVLTSPLSGVRMLRDKLTKK